MKNSKKYVTYTVKLEPVESFGEPMKRTYIGEEERGAALAFAKERAKFQPVKVGEQTFRVIFDSELPSSS